MLERQGVVSGECLEISGREIVNQDAGGMRLRDKAVMGSRPGMTQSEQRLGGAATTATSSNGAENPLSRST